MTESINQEYARNLCRLLFYNVPEYYYYTKYGQLHAKTLGAEEDKNPLTSLKYFYSRPGMIVAREVNGARQNYKYDKKGQLLGVYDDKGNAIEEYVYDPAGNILKKTVQGKTTTYKYDKANQLVSSECNGKVTKYEYDAAGRLVKEGDKVYSYIGLDKIESVTEGGQKLSSFTYHIDGQLAEAVTPEKRETFQWDGLALIQRNSTNYVNEPAVTGGNPILADNKVLFNDMLGTTLGIKDGDKVMQNNLTAFGESLNSSLLTENSFFTGKPHIGELGYAFLFRNYRPDQGKWQTADPLGYPDGWNNFAYVNNNVISFVDYLGTVAHSVTSDGIQYTWDWATSRIGNISWIEDFYGAKMGFEADVTWVVEVTWVCVRENGCQKTGKFTHSTVQRVTGIEWIQYNPGPGVEIPTFSSILEGIGTVAAKYLEINIPWPVTMDDSDIKKLLVRPSDATPMTNMKPVNHVCE